MVQTQSTFAVYHRRARGPLAFPEIALQEADYESLAPAKPPHLELSWTGWRAWHERGGSVCPELRLKLCSPKPASNQGFAGPSSLGIFRARLFFGLLAVEVLIWCFWRSFLCPTFAACDLISACTSSLARGSCSSKPETNLIGKGIRKSDWLSVRSFSILRSPFDD